MRNVAAFLTVTAFFVALNAIAAGVMLGVGRALLWALPSADDSRIFWLVAGGAGVAAAILSAKYAIAFINRPRRARHPAPDRD